MQRGRRAPRVLAPSIYNRYGRRAPFFSGNVMLHVLLLLGAGLHFVTTGSVRTSTSLFLVLCVRTRGQYVYIFSYSALGEKKRDWRKESESGGDRKMDVNTR